MEKAPRQRGHDRPRYRRVSTRIFGDERFRQLSPPRPNAQTLWMFLLVGPQTRAVPGLFSCGQAGLAEMLDWPIAGFRRAWGEIERLKMAQADWKARVVWIPNALRHNPPESPNVVRSWRVALDEIPECKLKALAVAEIEAVCEHYGQAFVQAFRQGRAKPWSKNWSNQDQEQDQEVPNPNPSLEREGNSPRPDPRSRKKFTEAELRHARKVRDTRFGCQHEPKCPDAEICVTAIAREIREKSNHV